MNITLYPDMFFLVNFLMDLLLLNLMKHFLRLPGSRRRMAAAAAAGAVCACALLIVQLWLLPCMQAFAEAAEGMWQKAGSTGTGLLWFAAGNLGIPALMLLAAFGRTAWPLFLKRMVVLWLLGAGMGGILSVAETPGMSGWYLPGTMAVRQWRLLPLMLCAAGIYFVLQVFLEQLARWRQEREVFCQVTLFYRGHCQTVTALWDTGNHLYEPYGHQPVHVITDEACRRLCDTVSQVAYIPFQAVGTGYGLLPGIRIDSMDVVRCGQPAAHYERPWLAISKGPLSAGGRYEMLLHGEKVE